MLHNGTLIWYPTSSPSAVRISLERHHLSNHFDIILAPYTAPHREYHSTEDLVKGQLPQFAYQLHLASGEVEKVVKDEASIRQFLRGMYGARGPNGELAFDPEKGVIEKHLPTIGESRILNGKVLQHFPLSYAHHIQKRKSFKDNLLPSLSPVDGLRRRGCGKNPALREYAYSAHGHPRLRPIVDQYIWLFHRKWSTELLT